MTTDESAEPVRSWLATLAAGLVVGSILAVCDQRVPEGASFSLMLLATAIFGLWAGRHGRSSAFRDGALITFITVLTFGLIGAVGLYRSSPYDQPDVLVPPLMFGTAVFVMAAMWGAVGGAFAYAASTVMKR